jgi:gluconokinase
VKRRVCSSVDEDGSLSEVRDKAAAAGIAPRAIVVMGVSGSGKSTLGARLAEALACPFLEADAFHGEANIAKMAVGEPLADADRWPWLDRLGTALAAAVAESGLAVAACSALKRTYRERLRAAVGAPVSFLFLQAEPGVLAARMAARRGHFMPASLLQSQLDALEAPGPDEPALTLAAAEPPERLTGRSLAWLGGGGLPVRER